MSWSTGNCASFKDAFIMGSDQIRKTQEEIAKLKAVVGLTGIDPIKKAEAPREAKAEESVSKPPQPVDDFEYTLFKMSKDPRFKQFIQYYIPTQQQPEIQQPVLVPIVSKSGFGRQYSDSIAFDVRQYILLFITLLGIYLFMDKMFKQ
jgi:hypothetical protein